MNYITKPIKNTLLNNVLFKLHSLTGWKIGESPPKKSYIYISEHTSNWDFFHGIFYYKLLDLDGYFVIAEEKTKFIPKSLVNYFRVIGIPRNSAGLSLIADELKKSGASLYIAPEGTRSATDGWKPGFHSLARKFNMQIAVIGLDYKNKRNVCLGVVDHGATAEETTKRCKDLIDSFPDFLPLHLDKRSPIEISPKYSKK